MSRYEFIENGGDTFYSGQTPDRPMIIRLYPNTQDQIGECGTGGIAAESILDACEQLYQHGSIDYYSLYRFRVEDSDNNEPDDYMNWDNIDYSFKEFLRDDNGSGYNIYDYSGVHQLIHEKSFGCDEDHEYAPKGAGAEHTDTSAFAEGVVAWSPICSDDGLTKNASIQEAVHCFLVDESYDNDLTGSNNDEHSLGKVNNWYTSPMLTYHWDQGDGIDESGGECPSNEHRAYYHTQSLTECTKKAVSQTAQEKA